MFGIRRAVDDEDLRHRAELEKKADENSRVASWLLEQAQEVGPRLRESREANHYGERIAGIFGGK